MAPHEEEDTDVAVAEEAKPRLKQPPQYAVLLHNDDYTTFEFVVEVLRKFFHKTEQEAAQITLKVHHEGKGLAGIFSHEIAETKVAQVTEHAQAAGYPLRCTAEEI
jgi:ATP-dependent Clp protease adaptor protein ClpS